MSSGAISELGSRFAVEGHQILQIGGPPGYFYRLPIKLTPTMTKERDGFTIQIDSVFAKHLAISQARACSATYAMKGLVVAIQGGSIRFQPEKARLVRMVAIQGGSIKFRDKQIPIAAGLAAQILIRRLHLPAQMGGGMPGPAGGYHEIP